MKVYIYTLSDPDSLQVRYVGKTHNIKKRLSSHINQAKRGNGRRYVLNWIKSLLTIGKKPTINIIEECDDSMWQQREVYWINHYRTLVHNLCNNADGGLGGTGTKNYTSDEIETRRITASKTFSKYTTEEKTYIWDIIKDKSYKEVKSQISRNIYFQVKNGYVWNDITGLIKKTPVKGSKPKRTINSGLKLTQDQLNFITTSSLSQNKIAKLINVSQAQVWRIRNQYK